LPKFDFIAPDYPDSLFRMPEFLELVSERLCSCKDLVFLHSIIFSKKPKNILEIGRNFGASTVVISGALSDNGDGELFSVDIKNILDQKVLELINHNTTVITDSSINLLSNSQLINKKFQIFFIDGDHSFNMVKNDLTKCLALSDQESIILCHDADCSPVTDAIKQTCIEYPTLINCGIFGEKIQMLIYRWE
jgi:predicted O-methyltransferase YrrM